MLQMKEPIFAASKEQCSQLQGIDYVEFYVGNPRQAAYFYQHAYGFTLVASAGLETGVRDRSSYVLQQGDIFLVLTGALLADSPIAEHTKRHGDSLKDIAFRVDNATQLFEYAVHTGGASPVMEPTKIEDEHGTVIKATVAAYGDTVHSFIERTQYAGNFLPNYHRLQNPSAATPPTFTEIDHIAVSVEYGQLDHWVEYYQTVFGLQETHQQTILTKYTGARTRVVEDQSRQIKFPIVESIPSVRKTQTEEFLDYNDGAGAFHIALLSDNIVDAVDLLSDKGVEFLRTPATYYDELEARVGKLDRKRRNALSKRSILMDKDDGGTLLQIFTKSVDSRPTIFWELIERHGATSFGEGNIKALFEAVEREQAQRGNL